MKPAPVVAYRPRKLIPDHEHQAERLIALAAKHRKQREVVR